MTLDLDAVREAGVIDPIELLESNQWRQDTLRELSRFAALLLEKAAQVCEGMHGKTDRATTPTSCAPCPQPCNPAIGVSVSAKVICPVFGLIWLCAGAREWRIATARGRLYSYKPERSAAYYWLAIALCFGTRCNLLLGVLADMASRRSRANQLRPWEQEPTVFADQCQTCVHIDNHPG